MNIEAAEVYSAGVIAHGDILQGFMRWADMLEGTEQAEARYHISMVANAFHNLTLAIQDHNGGIS